MFKRPIVLLILLLFSVFGVTAQQRAAWVDKVEGAIKKQFPDLEMRRATYKDNGGWLQYSLGGVYKGNGGHLAIDYLGNVTNVEETFRGFVTFFNNQKGPRTITQEIKGFGDEGVLWFDSNSNRWDRLYFRHKKFIIDLTFEEDVSRKLAAIVESQLPE